MMGRTSMPRRRFVCSTRLLGGQDMGWCGSAQPRWGRHCLLCLFGGATSRPCTSGRFVCTRPAWKRRGLELCRVYRANCCGTLISGVDRPDYGGAEYLTQDVLLALWDEMQ